MKTIRSFYLKIFIFGGEIFSIFEKACFRNNILHIAITDTSLTSILLSSANGIYMNVIFYRGIVEWNKVFIDELV